MADDRFPPKVWPPKDSNDVLDYGFDWSPRIGSADDEIESTTATVISGDIEVMDTAPKGGPGHRVAAQDGVPTGQFTKTWLRGGTIGETCDILMHAITIEGRELDQTMRIKIKER